MLLSYEGQEMVESYNNQRPEGTRHIEKSSLKCLLSYINENIFLLPNSITLCFVSLHIPWYLFFQNIFYGM